MRPVTFRHRAKVSADRMAGRLAISVEDLHALEATSLPHWDVADLAAYAGALGLRLRVTFVDSAERTHEVTL